MENRTEGDLEVISMSKSLLFYIVSCLSITPLTAHVYQADHWSNGSDHLFCLRDYHLSTTAHNKDANPVQRQNIIYYAKAYQATVIAEDNLVPNKQEIIADSFAYDPNKNYSHRCPDSFWKQDGIHPTLGPTCGLMAYCHKNEIPAINIEFRQVKGMSLNDGTITAATALQVADIVAQEIAAYNDSDCLNTYYRTQLAHYHEHRQRLAPLFQTLIEKNCSLKDALHDIPTIGYPANFEEIITIDPTLSVYEKNKLVIRLYDSPLVDLKIIHAIARTQGTMILCVGGGHIERISEVLPLIGFEQLATYTSNTENEAEPDALDLEQVFQKSPALPTPLLWYGLLGCFLIIASSVNAAFIRETFFNGKR
jgi:hypothetical protein